MLIYRRAMLKISEEILHKEKALAYVTGDSLGQVASQTLENIHVVRAIAKYPVLSPLIGMDKEEIIEIAKEIGTFETSILPYSDCCSMFIAEHPETRAKLENIEKEEKFDSKKLIKEAVENAEIVNF
jgi:thiamine biosynthesis protein ThiI